MISKQNAIRWANELRSGKYQQTKFKLQDSIGYCCLGVACEMFSGKHPRRYGMLNGIMPSKDLRDPEWLADVGNDFFKRTGFSLQSLNDFGPVGLAQFSFDEIADMIDIVYVYDRMGFRKTEKPL